MENKPNSRNRRSNGSSYNRNAKSRTDGGRRRSSHGYSKPRSNFGGNSRRRFTSNPISYDKYISNVSDTAYISPYAVDVLFEHFELADVLHENIRRKQYKNPTKIQAEVIPALLAERDILGIASTGSGKTGAFLMPLINKALADRNQKVLIIAPTRELAAQIKNEFNSLKMNTPLISTLTIGGANIGQQISMLRRNPNFVIGTPGRLLDLVARKALRLENFNNIVLDEVDQMLEMGFINDIKELISKLHPQKQSVFFSATLTYDAKIIADTLLKDPVRVEIKSNTALNNVQQDIVKVTGMNQKLEALHEILSRSEVKKAIVFSRTKRGADMISDNLQKKGMPVDSIHGDKPQRKRLRVLSLFKQDKIKVLIATDVASRGLDIPDVSHVINFDEPATYNDYVHRVGRTGRIGKMGVAFTFVK